MKVGWLADTPGTPGGAELTQAEFRAAAPDGVEIVACPPGNVNPGCDRYVIHNCVQYTLDDLRRIAPAARTVKYCHDVCPWVVADVRAWLARRAVHVCCSPAQADHMHVAARLIPPPVDLDRFARAAESVNGDRAGVVSVGSWQNLGKAPQLAAAWAAGQQVPIDFFGGGPLAPAGSVEVSYDAMPALLASYETFVFLPTVLEPFGRVVAEAWAAGCEIVTNDLVGAAYWIRENPDAIAAAADDFWELVTA